MSKQKNSWIGFFASVILLSVLLSIKFFRWGLVRLSNKDMFLISFIVIFSILIGGLVMKQQIRENNENAVLWGFFSTLFLPLGLAKLIFNKNTRIIVKILTVISILTILITCFYLWNDKTSVDSLNRGTIFLNYEDKTGNQLKIDFKSATNNFIERKTFDFSSKNEATYVSGNCGEGTFLIEIIQGEKQKKVTISQGSFDKKILLDFLEEGKFEMKIHVQDAKNTKLMAKIR